VDKDKMLLIEYEMEQVINKQLYEQGYITHGVYRLVANMIIKDMEAARQKLEAA
jgi:hypothetical protein